MSTNLITSSGPSSAAAERGASRSLTVLRGPVWSLRIEGARVSIVLQGAALPGGAELSELVIRLPHVSFPFDFREGIERFRHHRGQADGLELSVDARILLDWLHRVSGGRLGGTAHDDTLVLSGRTAGGARYTVRARLIADPDGDDGEPTLVLSLYHVRVYGLVDEPWPVLAGGVIDLLPSHLVVDRTLTTARIRIVRPALAWALSALGWKLPDVARLVARGVELREGRLVARFLNDDADGGPILTLDTMADGVLRGAFERFVEDLELKRHHGQVDRLLGDGQLREALAEAYRSLDGPLQPGFLAERLVGICASRAILYDEGERVCRELLRVSPTYEPALCGLASIALGRGRGEEAAVQLERLASVLTGPADREDATAADLTVAEILRDTAHDEARAALDRVLARSPDHEEALEMAIALSGADGDLRATLPLYKRLLFAARSRDRTREAGLRLARHALDRDQPEDARVFLRVVLEASPDDLEAQLALAEVERLGGDPLEAVRILEGALRRVPPTDPDNAVRVIAALARLILDATGDPARARRVLWRAVDLAPIADETALTLAGLALEADEPVLAERYLEPIAPGSRCWVEAQVLRAEGLLRRDDEAGALRAALAALDVDPAAPHALALLARCTPDLHARELLVDRLASTVPSLPPGPARARVLREVGSLYASLALRFDAIAPWEAALAEDPGGADAAATAASLLDLYAELGMWPKHQELCGERLPRERDPERRVALLVRVGRAALVELDDPAAARPHLEEAARLAPRHLEALELLRVALEELEQGIALIGVLSRLEALHPDEVFRDTCRLRLAELQLDGLDAPGQARATLARVGEAARRSPRAVALRRRLKLPVDPADEVVATARARRAAGPVRYEDAVALADRGELDEALDLLDLLLEARPDHTPARELAQVLAAQLEGIPRSHGASRPALVASRRGGAADPGPAPRTPVADTQEFEPPAASAARGPRSVAGRAPLAPQTVAPAGPARVDPVAGSPSVPAGGPSLFEERARESDAIDAALARAEACLGGDDPAGARAELEAALALDPDHLEALEALEAVLGALGDDAGRAATLERLASVVFDAERSAALLRELGEVRADALGDAAGALDAWRRVLSWRPLDRDLFERVRALHEARGELSAIAELRERQAEAWAEQEHGPEPEQARRRGVAAWREAAAVHLRAGAAEASAAAAGRGLALAPGEPELLELRLRASAAAGRAGDARDALARLEPMLLDGPLKDELIALVAS